jgi:group I intron endonuclease
LRLGTHHNKKLQGHFNKYGESDLQFSVILECPKEHLISREQDFLDALSPWFNICKTANSWLGNTHSEKTKKKQSIARTGVPGYFTGKIGPNKDRSFSVETKAAMSKSKVGNKNALGYIHSDKTREKLRLAWEKRKLNNQGNG